VHVELKPFSDSARRQAEHAESGAVPLAMLLVHEAVQSLMQGEPAAQPQSVSVYFWNTA
jgi:hypothetical protein